LSEWVTVCDAADVLAGHPVHVEVEGTRIAVFKLPDGFYAIEDVCTHDGGQLTGGCVEGEEIICPRHGARFSIKTGEALTAPAYESTYIFPVKIQNGAIQIKDDRWD
jgi:3-phenylpropionate/trans-cinnamate dioxygenase ferredoxin subunit